MKRLTTLAILSIFLFSAFAAGKGPVVAFDYPDSLRSVWLYTEGIKENAIEQDTVRAKQFFLEAIRNDSTFAPAYYEMAANGMFSTPEEAVELAGAACRLDSTNKWYRQFYGQTLIYARDYAKALEVYRNLRAAYPQDPDNYRILAVLYEQQQQPYSAIATLDSADVRFGRIKVLSDMKRHLLVATGQTERAEQEAKAMIATVPYEAEPYAVLGDLYGLQGKDSLARIEYDRALQIDSTSLETLLALTDFYNQRQDYRALLSTTQRLFELDDVPLDTKIKRFEIFTTDLNFYQQYYPQINSLAATLAVHYPQDKRVVELYAKHLITSGELEQALTLYKQHLDDTPPVESYYRAVIDIESYLQHPDSVSRYIGRALQLFPDVVDFHVSKGHALSFAKQYPEAIEAYKQSLDYAPTDSLRSVIWGYIGDSWHQKATRGAEEVDDNFTLANQKSAFRKDMKQCYKAYERSLHYDPDNAMVLNNYAYFLSLEGRDLEKAFTMSSRVVALTDNNPTYLDTYAWVLYKLGRLPEAKKIMQQAIALDTRNSAALLVHYGDILHAMGEQFMAETYWRKALEKGYDADQITRRFELEKVKKQQL